MNSPRPATSGALLVGITALILAATLIVPRFARAMRIGFHGERMPAPFMPAAITFNGTGGNDILEVRRITGGGSDDIQFLVGGVLTDSQPFANVDSIIVNGLDGNDTLTVNYGASGGFFNQPLTFHGGNPTTGPGDKLVVTGNTFATAVSTLTSAGSGNIVYDIDGNLLTTVDQATITYDGLEPVDITGSTINDLVFNLPSGTVGASLQDDGVAANNTSQIASTNATFETTNFAVPIKSLTVNAGGGTDTITTAAGFSGDFNAALTINGTAATDNVTLNALTLGNAGVNSGNLSVTGNSINVKGAIDTTPGSTGTVTMTARQSISVNSTGGIKTSDGNINLSANQQATPASGSFFGVSVSGGTVQATGTGVVTVSGRGGDDAAGQQIGVVVQSGGVISGGTTGTNTITGTGGASSSDSNAGVAVSGAASQITSAGGAVQVTGHGGGSGASGNNSGVLVQGGGVITAGGSGQVTILGNSIAVSGSDNFGVLVRDTNSAITSGGGDVSVTGNGGGTGASAGNIGVQVNLGGTITAGGTGTVTVQGTGGGGSGIDNTGVLVASAGSTITSGGGNISVTGTAGTSANSFGADIGRGGGGSVTSTGTGNITLTGDSMLFDTTNAVIDAGANIVTLQNKTLGTAISLGGADAPGTLGLTDAELDRVKAGKLRIGRNDANASGTITLSNLIDLTVGANIIPTLHLLTGAGVADGTAGEQTDLKVASLAIEAASGIGSSNDLNVTVTNLAAADSGAASSGNILIGNVGALTITTVDSVAGVTRSLGAPGIVVVTAASPLTVNAPVTDNTGGDITLTAGSSNSNNAADVLTINANVTCTGGNGSIALNGNNLVVNAATVSVVGLGNVSGNLGGTGGGATFNNGSAVSSVNGFINVIAAASITLNGNAALNVTGAENISLRTDDMAVASTATISANDGVVNGNNIVTVQTFSFSRPIDLGSNTPGKLGLTDTELSRVTAEVLRVGHSPNAGDITVSNSIARHAGYNTLALLTGTGGITQTASLSVAKLRVETTNSSVSLTNAGNDVDKLSGRATTSGNLSYTDANSLAVDTVDGVAGISLDGGTITLITTGDLIGPVVADAVPDLVANTINLTSNGGKIGASGAVPLEIVATSTPTAGLNANSSGGNIFISATNGDLVVGQVNAGAGNITLNVFNQLRSASPNDGTAEAIGNAVSLAATGPTNGNTGQIGFFTVSAQFFEVNANVLNASTNNSRLWIREVGSGGTAGTAIGSVNAGTNTAFLQVDNGGNLTSQTVDGNADVTAAAVNLRALNGGNLGVFAGTPLEINASSLNAAVQNAAGTINVINTSPALSIVLAQTVSGNIAVKGNDLNLTGAVTAGSSVTLTSNTGSFNGGGTITATDIIFNDGSSSGHTWTIIPASVTVAPGSAIPYSTTTNLTANGGSAGDTFNVTPSSTTTFNVNGNNPKPPASPGDSLAVDVSGTSGATITKTSTPNGFQGAFTFGNRKPVNFTTIETLSCASAAPVAITCPGGLSRFTDPGQTSATINPGTPVTSGGCGTVTVTGVRSDGKPLNARYPVGTTTITWTAKDQIGNSTSCVQTIIVMVPADDRRHP